MNGKTLITSAILLLLVFASACSGQIPNTGPVSPDQAATQNALIYQAAQSTATAIAVQNQISQLQTQVAQGNQGGQSTAVSPAEATQPAPTQTPEPTATATQIPPTATQVPPTATITPTPIPCNSAQFVTDVSVPDGTTFAPNSNFTKTWRLRNTGTCIWTTAYSVVFYRGNSLDGPSAVDLPGRVNPGDVVDISLSLVAPDSDGTYRSEWKLRDASGVIFGLGRSNTSFFTEIRVSTPASKYPLDFVASMCQARWTSGAGTLPCPGTDNSASGFVMRVNNPTLESGYVDNEPALVTYPQMITDGVIRGKYPSFKVETGDHFEAVIGCARDAKSCDVNFQLDYQIDNGSIQTMKVWHEIYDEKFNSVDVDLSSLAGQNVRFILTVYANGSSTQDRAQWLAPRIVKP